MSIYQQILSLSIASMTTLVFVTILLCLSCCMSIRGNDLSKHLVVENGSKLGYAGSPETIKSAGNSSNVGSTKEEQSTDIQKSMYAISISDLSMKVCSGYQSHDGTLWHGVRAAITVWNIPDVQPFSSSGAYIAAINYKAGGQELIAAGFHVSPSLYKDNEVHFFTYWTTTRDYSTGCYNKACPGFVEADGTDLYAGEPFAPPLSTYDGEKRSIKIRIKKDEHTGDWSLYREDLAGIVLLGWWPGTLFQYLSEKAEIIQWTGFASHYSNETSPSMGSGHFPRELEGKAASFNDCFGFDQFGEVYDDIYDPVKYYIDRPDCYDVSEWYDTKKEARRHFFYGGPGGCSVQK